MHLTPLKFDNDPVTYISPSWDEMNHLTFQVSKKLKKESNNFDRIVTLAKGGWPMTRSLIDFSGIPEIASIGIKFYSGVNQRFDKPVIYQDIPVSVENEKILLFDDVADTGESLIFTKKLLEDRGAKEVKTATIFYKPHSQLKPDFFGEETTAWIVFPFEPFEMIELIGGKWLSQDLTITEITQRFRQFNFSDEIISAAVDSLK